MIFTTQIKIHGYHLDHYGHVNNARWVELLEEARWRWLEHEIDLTAWDEVGQGLAVLSIAVNYRRPAHMHDTLDFRCHVTKLGGRSAVCRQEVYREGGDEKLLDADVTFVFIDIASGKIRPRDETTGAMLEKYHHHEGRPS